ncbi:Hypothetical protein, putative [Bodo saltans]|uniref:Uncharacterized protein n=1 Tax=Bodo saltans TaxID=75058 RepID=A0A0S4KJX3_BODSA|nr:Hypothetical protein, putative [Bodo saltans]|eukprot:CUI15493.1 Hypothetical protein, putative [Bodo saltans]
MKAARTNNATSGGAAASLQRPLPTEIISYHDGYEAQNGTLVQYQPEWTKQHQLEGDGLLPLLYDHLWKSDRTREHRLREAFIPDTVVFEHNFPRAWYTFDTKTQEIVKRAGKLLDSQSIHKFFCEEERGCDIVAQFYHKSVAVPVTGSHARSAKGSGRSSTRGTRGGGSASAAGHHHHGSSSAAADDRDEELTTAVEYFTKDTLFDFLHNQKTKPDGVLQKFLIPKGETSARHNFQLQAVWSPLVTLVYKRTNKHRLSDKTTPVHQRGATFDGLAHHSAESLVADGTKARIDELCKTIVQHFFLTEHKQITRLVLYFKIDDLERIWVLWASSLRIGSDKLNPSYLRVPIQLAMRVENVNGGTSRDELAKARHKMHKQLVDKDIDLYNLTGDWAFASQCAQKFDHDAFLDERRNKSPSSRAVSPRRPAPIAITGPSSSRIPQPPASEAARGSVEFLTPSEFHNAPATPSAPRYRGRAATDTYSSTTSERNNPHQRMYISPRAPFLPTVDRQTNSDVQSPRHPLHSAYALTHETNPDGSSSSAGGGLNGKAGNVRTQRTYASATGDAPGTPKAKQYTVKLRKTEQERIHDELNSQAQDLLYDTYSTTMDGANASSQQQQPQQTITQSKIVFPSDIMRCLSVSEIAELARVLHVTVDPEAELALNKSSDASSHAGETAAEPQQAPSTGESDDYYNDNFDTDRIVATYRIIHL